MHVPQWSRGGALVALLLAFVLLVATAGAALAADSARIQDVSVENGSATFQLTAVGLAEGESLDPASVEVTIDGKAVAVTTTEAAEETEAQRGVYLVMDTSGSMEGIPLDAAKSAGQEYLDSVPADVAVGLITFADQAVVAVPATQDRGAVSAALQSAQADGSTALFDAAVLATVELGTEGARSIVMLSDGEDEGSAATEPEALAAITASGVALDAVALTSGAGAEQLARMAQAGGGSAIQAADAQTLTEAFESAARSAASQVLVTAEIPAGQQAGTVPLTASVVVGGARLADEAVLVIDAEAAAAAAAVNASAAGPVPVETATVGVMQQPWFLPVAVMVLFGAFATIGLLAVRYVNDDALQKRRVRRRVEQYATAGGGGDSWSSDRGGDPDAPAQRAVALAEEFVKERDPDRRLETKLASAAIPLKPGEWVLLRATSIFAAGLIATFLSGFSIGWTLVGLAVGFLVPYLVLAIRVSSRRKQFYTSLPETLQLLSGSVATGYSFLQAVSSVAEEGDDVIAQEFGRAVAEARLGVPVEDALEDVATRMDSRDLDWVVMAVRINKQVGGNLAEVLRTVSKTLRERERLRRQVAALTAEGRYSAWIIGAIPFVILGYMALTRPEHVEFLFTTTAGWLMLLGALVMEVIGVLWITKMIKMEL